MNQTPKNPTNPESFVIHRRIGSTTFLVNVHFSEEGRETLEEKALRLMKNELHFVPENIVTESEPHFMSENTEKMMSKNESNFIPKSKVSKNELHLAYKNAKMEPLQAGWLSERGSA